MRIVLSHVYGWPEVRRGGERYLHELGAALHRSGHDVRILTSAPRAGRGEQLGVPVRYLKRRRFRPPHYRELADEVAFGLESGARMAISRADVWHSFGTADSAAAAELGRVRSWRSVHHNLGIPARSYRDARPDRRIHELVVRHVDDYLCLSESAARPLTEGYGREPDVVGGGVDLDRFEPAERRHPVPALLFSGSLTEPRKNLPLLLDAVAVLRRRRPDVELWLSGPGDAREVVAGAPDAARQAAVDLGLGRPDEQAGRYGRAWVTVLPSVREAFGLVLVESLACGTPIVALAGGGGPAEIVREGVGFRADDTPDGLADACEAALDLAAQPGTAAACRAAAGDYDWDRSIVPRLEAIYRRGR